MNGIFLSCFALFALPSVLAISCYTCIPSGIGELCTNVTNVTNCDNDQSLPAGSFDACAIGSVQMKMGPMTFTSNAMTCAVKAAQCGAQGKETFCNLTTGTLSVGGMTVEKCEYSCCETNECNSGVTPTVEGISPTAPSHEATSSVAPTHKSQTTTNEPTDEGTTIASSFIITAASLLVLLSGFFGH